MARVRTESRFPPEGGFYSVATGCEIVDLAGADRKAAAAKVLATLTPPTIEQAEGWLVMLQAGTAHRSDSEAGSAVGLTLYAGALCEYPADVARAACAKLAKTQKWFPTLSELIALCDQMASTRRVMLAGLRNATPALRYAPEEPTEESRATVRQMAAAFVQKHRESLPAKSKHDFSKSQGRVDETGITPEFRALLQRQQEEAR